MHKVIRLLKRREGVSVEKFQDQWDQRMRRILSGRSSIIRYVQSHPLPQGYHRGELAFDGVEELWFDGEEEFADFAARRDVVETTGEIARTESLLTLEVDTVTVIDGSAPHRAIKSIELMARSKALSPEEFSAYWAQMHGPLAREIETILRYEQNHVRQTVDAPSPRYDGVAITWFSSTREMRRSAESDAYAVVCADEENFIDRRTLALLLTRERILVDAT